MPELKFAVVGAGFWGRFQIAAWHEVSGSRIVAICDRDRARGEQVARMFGVPAVYAEAEEMLRSEPLDFIDVAVGPEAHAELVLLAARRRLPVICQKPMAMDYPTCESMVRACLESGTPFLIHENYRWQSPMRRVQELLASGIIGRAFRAHIQFSHGDIRLFENQTYLFAQPHFAMHDMGPHLLDLARFFFGEPCSLYAREFRIDARFTGADIVSIILAYPEFTCHCELSWRTAAYEVFIEGVNGTITWNPEGSITVRTNTGEFSETLVPRPYSWADPRYGFAHPSIVATNTNLLAALRGEGFAETTAEDNLKTMRLLHLALESASSNQALPV